MNNTISVNYMTKAYNSFLRTHRMLCEAGGDGEFSRELVEKYECMKETAEMKEIGAVSTKDMSMEEYK